VRANSGAASDGIELCLPQRAAIGRTQGQRAYTKLERRADMVMSCIELLPAHDKRLEVLEILNFVKSNASTNPACLYCAIYQKVGNNDAILYVEQWGSERDLRLRIQSRSYLPVLNAMDLSREKPIVTFYEIATTRSMELVESWRAAQ
jgi:quinol monooxygenase YgiN